MHTIIQESGHTKSALSAKTGSRSTKFHIGTLPQLQIHIVLKNQSSVYIGTLVILVRNTMIEFRTDTFLNSL